MNTAEERWEFPGEQGAPSSLGVEGLIKRLERVDRAEIRRSAAEGLGQLGSAAIAAIPALVNSAIDKNAAVREAALEALNAIDPTWPKNAEAHKAIPSLVAALRNQPSDVIKAATSLLSSIGPPAVPSLADALADGEDTVDKVYVLRALAPIGLSAASAVPEIALALDSHYLQVRIAAADTLVKIGPTAEIILALMAGLADSYSDGREAMAVCLGRAGVMAEPAIPALLPLLADRQHKVRNAAAKALEQIGPGAVPALVEIVKTRDLQRLKAWVKATTRVSQWLKEPRHHTLVADSLETYRNLSWAAYDILEERECLEMAQAAALRVLGRFGPAASSAVAVVVGALEDPTPRIRLAAIQALGRIGPAVPTAENVVPGLVRALEDSTPRIRLAAVQALSQIGPAAPNAETVVPGLVRALVDSDESVRDASAEAIRDFDRKRMSEPLAIDAIMDLLGQLESPGELAVQAFASIGAASVPILIDVLESGNRIARANAARALGLMGPEAQAAIPMLTQALQDSHPWVRAEATKALAQIDDHAA
jgi:HEAT repeat protein